MCDALDCCITHYQINHHNQTNLGCNSPLQDDLVAVYLSRLHSLVSACLTALLPLSLLPARSAGNVGAGLVDSGLQSLVTETVIYRGQFFLGGTCGITDLVSQDISINQYCFSYGLSILRWTEANNWGVLKQACLKTLKVQRDSYGVIIQLIVDEEAVPSECQNCAGDS